ncbi:MAG: hypothetical protein RL410_841 [Actinomycetota bacterium]|jgi:hypothetical protein
MSTVARVAALLAMAERTDNQHEADAFFAKAQQLATAASVDLALARAVTARQESREQPITKTITVGDPGVAANKHLVALFIGISRANDLRMDIAHNSTYVILYGMPSDIEVTEVLFNSISTQMFAQADLWVRGGEWKDDKYWSTHISANGYRVPVKKPHTAKTARSSFCAAFTERICQRVQNARDEALADYRRTHADTKNESGALISTEIVLRDKAAEVNSYYRGNSKAAGHWKGYSGAGARGTAGKSTSAGKSAANRARIGRQSELGKGSGQITS